MMRKEAKARIKINTLLQDAGWRFFDNDQGPATVVLENNVKLTKQAVDDLGNDFDKTENGFIDFLLLDEKGFPYVVLEAKSEDKDPLDGKEFEILASLSTKSDPSLARICQSGQRPLSV